MSFMKFEGDPFGAMIAQLDRISAVSEDAYKSAARETLHAVHEEMVSKAREAGADDGIVNSLRVNEDDDRVYIGINGDEEAQQKMLDFEYGTVSQPPTALIRNTFSDSKKIQQHFEARFASRLREAY